MANETRNPPFGNLRQLEHRTKLTVSIAPTTSHAYRRTCKQQHQSHLFKLPAELRMHVYELVLAQYDDAQNTYNPQATHSRPGFRAAKKTDTRLLSTCRRVWLEANHLALQLATHVFWFFDGPHDRFLKVACDSPERVKRKRRPKTLQQVIVSPLPAETHRYQVFFKALTPLNYTQLSHVHVFASQQWLSLFDGDPVQRLLNLDVYFDPDWFAAKRLKVTIRDGDWGLWSQKPPHFADHCWLNNLLEATQLRGVEELCLELEMVSAKHERLQLVVDCLASRESSFWQRQGAPTKSTWSKQSAGEGCGMRSACTKFDIVTLRWRNSATKPCTIRHIGGALVKDGGLCPLEVERRRAWKIGKKRGGRRSKSVWLRNHWQALKAQWQSGKDANASQLQSEWVESGSLLRLVQGGVMPAPSLP